MPYTGAGPLAPTTLSGTALVAQSTPLTVLVGLRGYLAGCGLANNGTTPATKVDFAPGTFASDIGNFPLALLGSTMTKSISSSWAVGTGNGGMDTGSAPAAGTLHCFLIVKDSDWSVDALFSQSVTPTMPGGYTNYRRVGSVRTSSSNVVAFYQNADWFLFLTPVSDVSVSNPGATTILRTLTTPGGIRTTALIYVHVPSSGLTEYLYLSSPDVTDIVPSSVNASLSFDYGAASNTQSGQFQVPTNTSSQIRSRFALGTNTSFYVNTQGWIDTRGRFA